MRYTWLLAAHTGKPRAAWRPPVSSSRLTSSSLLLWSLPDFPGRVHYVIFGDTLRPQIHFCFSTDQREQELLEDSEYVFLK